MNVIGYVRKYGKLSFKEEYVNNIDYMIFSMLSYIDFDGIISRSGKNKIRLQDAASLYFSKYDETYLKNQIIATRSAIKILKVIKDEDRYKDLLLYDYDYECSHELQFSAFVIELGRNLKVITYEGTDDLISGWKEDFEMSYMFPVPAQRYALKYAKRHIHLFDRSKYVLVGHSKGGNIALVAGMYLGLIKKLHLKKIYSFDGPGLMENQINSIRYKCILKKYKHYIPDCSFFGLLYKDKKYTVVKSNRNDIIGHDAYTWEIVDNDFLYTDLSKGSLYFSKTFNDWVDEYSLKERKYITEKIFEIFDKCCIDSLFDLNDKKFITILGIIKEAQNLDEKTKKVLIRLFKLMFSTASDLTFGRIKGRRHETKEEKGNKQN